MPPFIDPPPPPEVGCVLHMPRMKRGLFEDKGSAQQPNQKTQQQCRPFVSM